MGIRQGRGEDGEGEGLLGGSCYVQRPAPVCQTPCCRLRGSALAPPPRVSHHPWRVQGSLATLLLLPPPHLAAVRRADVEQDGVASHHLLAEQPCKHNEGEECGLGDQVFGLRTSGAASSRARALLLSRPPTGMPGGIEPQARGRRGAAAGASGAPPVQDSAFLKRRRSRDSSCSSTRPSLAGTRRLTAVGLPLDCAPCGVPGREAAFVIRQALKRIQGLPGFPLQHANRVPPCALVWANPGPVLSLSVRLQRSAATVLGSRLLPPALPRGRVSLSLRRSAPRHALA